VDGGGGRRSGGRRGRVRVVRSVVLSMSSGSRVGSVSVILRVSESSAEAGSDSSALLMSDGFMLSTLVLVMLMMLILMLERRVVRTRVLVLDPGQAIVLARHAGAVASSNAVERVKPTLLEW
jgi:hypothetical protein